MYSLDVHVGNLSPSLSLSLARARARVLSLSLYRTLVCCALFCHPVWILGHVITPYVRHDMRLVVVVTHTRTRYDSPYVRHDVLEM